MSIPALINAPSNRYCAPDCGRGCTRTEYIAARRSAAQLVAMLGRGWKQEVWDNLGWHAAAVDATGMLHVHVPSVGLRVEFSAFLSPDGGGGGRWFASHANPIRAVQSVIKQARDEIDRLMACVNGIRLPLAMTPPRELRRRANSKAGGS